MNKPLIRSSPLWTLPAVILLIAIALVIYSKTFNASFVFDDQHNIVENPHIRMTRLTPEAIARILKSPSNYRPLANLSFAANHYIDRYNVRGYHVVNLIIHIITALLVWLVARQTFALSGAKTTLVPFLAAALWLVNPIHTQSITYIVQRMNSLATMFYMLALFCYIQARINATADRNRLQPRLYYVFCLISATLGLASKEIVVTLPVIVLLYEWFFFQNLDRAWLRKQLPWIGLAGLVIIALAIYFMGGISLSKLRYLYEQQVFTMGQRLMTEPQIVLYYLTLLAFPHPARLILDYNFPLALSPLNPATTLPAIMALVALTTAGVYAAKRHRLLSFAILWFLVTLSIESSFIGLALIFEHRTYLPSIFPIIGFVWLVFHIRPKSLATAIMCVAVGICGVWTYQRNSTWQDAITLWQDTIAKTPGKARLYNNLGLAYKDSDEIDKAMACYKKACQLSTPREEIHAIALTNIGELLLKLDRPKEAEDFFRLSITTFPGYENAHINLGVAQMRMGRTDEAIASNNRALAINSYLEKAYNNLGSAWFMKGDIPRAVKAFNQALTVRPDYPEALDNLTKVKHIFEKYGSLISQAETVAGQNPEDPQAAFLSGQISQAAGMTDRAIFWFEQALTLVPDRSLYLNTLGNCYAAIGRIEDAIKMFERMAELIPDNPTVFYNLACLYARNNDRDKAVERLQQAVEKGYQNWPHLLADKDLENISNSAYYKSLMRK